MDERTYARIQRIQEAHPTWTWNQCVLHHRDQTDQYAADTRDENRDDR